MGVYIVGAFFQIRMMNEKETISFLLHRLPVHQSLLSYPGPYHITKEHSRKSLNKYLAREQGHVHKVKKRMEANKTLLEKTFAN